MPRAARRYSSPLEALIARATRDPDAIVLIDSGAPWSCGRLAGDSACLAQTMRNQGVLPGDRVALHMVNRVELVLAYLACWRIGAIATPLNARHKPAELASMIGRVRPALYLGEAALCDGVRDIPSAALPLDARFAVGLDVARGGARPWAALDHVGRLGSLPTIPDEPTDGDRPAVLLATSGTTGQSKLVIWTDGTMAALAATAPDRGITERDTVPIAVPLAHSSGAYLLAACLVMGASIVLLPRFEAEAVLDAIEAHRCTTYGGLPSMSAELARRQQARPRDVSSLEFCFSGGDVCTDETEQAFRSAVDRPLRTLWSLTEDSMVGVPATRSGPLTRLAPEAEAKLVDGFGAPVADGETGELMVRSPSTTPGYWLGPGQIDPLPDGWLKTGDLMRREPDRHLRYMGRLKDVIVRSDAKLSPIEIEETLRRQPGVADAAVVGLPDRELGQRVGAALVLTEGTTVHAVPVILAGVRRDLSDVKVPEAVAVVPSIPCNALAKVDRAAVATLVAQRPTSA